MLLQQLDQAVSISVSCSCWKVLAPEELQLLHILYDLQSKYFEAIGFPFFFLLGRGKFLEFLSIPAHVKMQTLS